MATAKPAARKPKDHPGRKGHDPETVDKVLSTVVRCWGNKSEAARLLADEGFPIPADTLRTWIKGKYKQRYYELSLELAPEREQEIAQDMLEVAGRSTQTQHLAVQKAYERLEAGEENDPARAAVNLARVGQINIDKMLSLTGRPTQIRESHDVEGLLRGLVAMGILKPPEAQPQIVEATTEEDA